MKLTSGGVRTTQKQHRFVVLFFKHCSRCWEKQKRWCLSSHPLKCSWILNGELRAQLWKSRHVVEDLNAALNFPLDPSMEALPLELSQLETWLVFDHGTGPSTSMLVLTLYLLHSNPLC
nr:hypothetical protein Iba_chr06eCG9640 [Ipomoea batatas]